MSTAAGRPSGLRNAAFYAIFIGILGLISLVLLEGALRLYQWVRQDSRTIVSDEVLHHRLRPNLNVVDRRNDPPHRLITNAVGFVEDREIARTKAPGTYRIIYVGDSNVQGLVDFPYKMVRLVSAGLNAGQRPPGFEVINAGTSSYSPYPYHLLVKTMLLGYAPDLVVINVDMTDVSNDDMYRRFALYEPDGDLRALVDAQETSRFGYIMTPTGLIPVEQPSALYRWLVEHTATMFYVDKVWTRLRVGGSLGGAGYDLDQSANWLAQQWTPDIEAAVTRSTDMLARTVQLLRSRGVKVAITSVPHQPQFAGEWSARPHQALAEFCAKLNVPFLDGYDAVLKRVERSQTRSLYFRTDDTHFNIVGNRVWADAQLEFLRDPRFALIPR